MHPFICLKKFRRFLFVTPSSYPGILKSLDLGENHPPASKHFSPFLVKLHCLTFTTRVHCSNNLLGWTLRVNGFSKRSTPFQRIYLFTGTLSFNTKIINGRVCDISWWLTGFGERLCLLMISTTKKTASEYNGFALLICPPVIILTTPIWETNQFWWMAVH